MKRERQSYHPLRCFGGRPRGSMLCISSRDSSRETIAYHAGLRIYRCKRQVCRSLEEILIPQGGLRPTILFEESHRRAGREGDILFMVSLVVMTLVSYIVACFSFGAGCRSCRLVSCTLEERTRLLFGKRSEQLISLLLLMPSPMLLV